MKKAKNKKPLKAARKSVRLMGKGVYDRKDLWKRYAVSLEWKSEGVMDDERGKGEGDENDEDRLVRG